MAAPKPHLLDPPFEPRRAFPKHGIVHRPRLIERQRVVAMLDHLAELVGVKLGAPGRSTATAQAAAGPAL